MSIGEILQDWANRVFGHYEALVLVALIAIGLLLLIYLGAYLAPILTGLVVAFALSGVVKRLVDWRVPKLLAILLVMIVFIGVIVALFVVILPLVWTQLQTFATQLPELVLALQTGVNDLVEAYPDLIPATVTTTISAEVQSHLTDWSAMLLQKTVQQLPNLIMFVIFLILVPISLFLFLRDRELMLNFIKNRLPTDRPLLDQVGSETLIQMGRYVRGKLLEILIVGSVCYIAFLLLDLQYAALLALLVGLSVIIPFIGAAVVTIPLVLVALFQFGWTFDFAIVVIVYAVIQTLDANVLVPFLFSETNDLHPIVIIG